jgi:thymidylate kinase
MNMKILIFEGIATSGKSTVIRSLEKRLRAENLFVLSEDETHLPIREKRENLHLDFFMRLVARLTEAQPAVALVDRFYLTQAVRARSPLTAYATVEDMLQKHDVQTVLLTVAEDKIAERLRNASEHRDTEWLDYLKSKGEDFETISQDYIAQQRKLIELTHDSSLPCQFYETSASDYGQIVDQLYASLEKLD